MKQLHHFATRDDLCDLLAAAEERGPLKYTLTGSFGAPRCHSFDHGSSIPSIGRASASQTSSCETYLVCRRDYQLQLRSIGTAEGKRFCIDQMLNPDDVALTPGGRWGENTLIAGRVATSSTSPEAGKLMRVFHSALKKQFTKVKAFWLGPEARDLWRSALDAVGGQDCQVTE